MDYTQLIRFVWIVYLIFVLWLLYTYVIDDIYDRYAPLTHCVGTYCNGTPITGDAAKLGAQACGYGNLVNVCEKYGRDGTAWVPTTTKCPDNMTGRC